MSMLNLGPVSLKGVKPGDELLLVDRHSRCGLEQEPKVVRVHKVGPKRVQVLRDESRPEFGVDFYRVDGGQLDDGYGHSLLISPRQWEEERRRERVERSLRRHGVEVWRMGPKPVPLLEKLLAVLEEEGECR